MSNKVGVVTYHPQEDDVQVIGVLTKATKGNVLALLKEEFEDKNTRVRIQPKTQNVEFSYRYGDEWDEWDESGCYKVDKKVVHEGKATGPLKLELEFKESDLNDILRAANFGESKPYTVAELKKLGRYDDLIEEMKITAPNFVFEIVDGSEEACANDWLNQFDRSDEDEDEFC